MQTISGLAIKRLQEKQQGDFEIHACFTVEMFGGKRWCFTTCTLFMLCLRSSYVAASPPRERLNFNKLSIPKSLRVHGKSFTPRWTLNFVKDNGTSSRLDEVEPGFDFCDEEMKKLKIWPGGAIPYYIDEFSFDKVFRDRIRNFLDVTNSMTGLNFLELHRPPGDDETRWVFFVNRQGVLSCVDHPFKNFTSEGVQKILLGYDCLSNGGGLAEVVLGLVGVPPQHNAPNRNDYIEIVKKNIMPGKAYLFEPLKNNEWLFHEMQYDFESAGHYNLHKYTINGKATIKPLDIEQEICIGDAKGFSYGDILKIRMIYNYISKKRLKSVGMPECNKLFNLGTNFSHYVHESEDDVQPRNKPNKYLGLPDELEKSPFTDNTSYDIEVSKEETLEEINSEKEQDLAIVGQKSDESKEEMNTKSNENATQNIKIVNEDVTVGNSAPRLDSRSDNEGKPRLLKFTRPGYKFQG